MPSHAARLAIATTAPAAAAAMSGAIGEAGSTGRLSVSARASMSSEVFIGNLFHQPLHAAVNADLRRRRAYARPAGRLLHGEAAELHVGHQRPLAGRQASQKLGDVTPHRALFGIFFRQQLAGVFERNGAAYARTANEIDQFVARDGV